MGAARAARAQQRILESATLQRLARDLSSEAAAEREGAVALLSSLTVYLEHHPALLDAGVLPALMRAIADPETIPQVRTLALGCAADLMKADEAQQAAVAEPDFIPTVLDALQARGRWREGQEQGAVARTAATRLLAELAGRPALHPLLASSGAAAALAAQGAELAAESAAEDKTYGSLKEVPGTIAERHAVDEERHSSAALYGLAASPAGAGPLLDNGGAALTGMARWAGGRDPILQRYGVGGLARLAGGGPAGFEAVQRSGGLNALVGALTCADPQTQCFAAGALGKLAEVNGAAAVAAEESGAAERLVEMLRQRAPNQPPPTGGEGTSPAVRAGALRCGLRAALKLAAEPHLCAALKRAGAREVLQELASAKGLDAVTRELAKEAANVLQ
ncbi:hypothetical protein WJX81_004589 [Elliptochloris bilobata]|uniref:Uncharacterized protein n=1 Tax=Elliptochloris bilobata TaxID=381761 RepID=A0AAW1SEW3_9CHLO